MNALPSTPSRDAMVRDGIPPALLDWHREHARALRAHEIARLGAALAAWLQSLRPAAPLTPRDAGF